MKILISFLFLVITSEAFSFDPDYELDRISNLSKKGDIHLELLKLKNKNEQFKVSLQKEKSYKPNVFHYTITLKYLLDKVPKNINEMPDCKSLYGSILNDYKVKWQELRPPTHLVWKSFEKLCRK